MGRLVYSAPDGLGGSRDRRRGRSRSCRCDRSGERKGGRQVVLLDGAKALGAKILVSGGGRCNVTHETVTAADFFGNRRIIKNVLAAWSVERTIEWFAGMGVELKREATGKLFPTTDKARTVLDALLERCHGLSVEIQTGRRVSGIERADERLRCPPQRGSHRRKGGYPRDRRSVASEIGERWFGLYAGPISRSFADLNRSRARATGSAGDDVSSDALRPVAGCGAHHGRGREARRPPQGKPALDPFWREWSGGHGREPVLDIGSRTGRAS